VPHLEHLRQREGFLGAAARVAQHEVVPMPSRLERDRIEHRGKERIGNLADD